MEILLALVAGGGAVLLGRRAQQRRLDRRLELAELEAVRTLADDDVTLLGEELRRLDSLVAGRDLDEDTRVDYQRALDAYESAARTARRMRSTDEVSLVADALAQGRHALVCVQARLAGEPVPPYRVPCFFNPQHGPSVREVLWTQPGRGTRLVPACRQDAARVTAHERPDVRRVRIGPRRVPYWEAGAAFAPYTPGYHLATRDYVLDVYAFSLGVDPARFGTAAGGFIQPATLEGEGGR
ncbi:MAG TPA: hypothetical protein VFZ64_07945 [Nocardioidaceae bacterium]